METIVVALVSAVTFVGLMSAATFLYWGLKAREETAARELARRLGTLTEKTEDRLFRLRVRDTAVDALGTFGQKLDGIIRQAGEEFTVSDLLARCALFALLGVVALALPTRSFVALLGLVVGLVPVLLLIIQGNQRAHKISEQLPDALDLVGRSLQAGHGFSDALRMCAEEMPLPISGEFGRIYEEHRLGRDFRECLLSMVERNPSNFDLKIFVSAVLLQRDTGGNLIEILDNIAKTVRDRFVLTAKIKALTAEARISAVILAMIPLFVSAMIMLVRYDYLAVLVNDPAGLLILAAAVTLYVTGGVVMYQLSRLET